MRRIDILIIVLILVTPVVGVWWMTFGKATDEPVHVDNTLGTYLGDVQCFASRYCEENFIWIRSKSRSRPVSGEELPEIYRQPGYYPIDNLFVVGAAYCQGPDYEELFVGPTSYYGSDLSKHQPEFAAKANAGREVYDRYPKKIMTTAQACELLYNQEREQCLACATTSDNLAATRLKSSVFRNMGFVLVQRAAPLMAALIILFYSLLFFLKHRKWSFALVSLILVLTTWSTLRPQVYSELFYHRDASAPPILKLWNKISPSSYLESAMEQSIRNQEPVEVRRSWSRWSNFLQAFPSSMLMLVSTLAILLGIILAFRYTRHTSNWLARAFLILGGLLLIPLCLNSLSSLIFSLISLFSPSVRFLPLGWGGLILMWTMLIVPIITVLLWISFFFYQRSHLDPR